MRQPHDYDEDDEPEFDYPPPEKRKQPPQMNLLKRSVSLFLHVQCLSFQTFIHRILLITTHAPSSFLFF